MNIFAMIEVVVSPPFDVIGTASNIINCCFYHRSSRRIVCIEPVFKSRFECSPAQCYCPISNENMWETVHLNSDFAR